MVDQTQLDVVECSRGVPEYHLDGGFSTVCNSSPPGMFLPLDVLNNIGLIMWPSDPFMSKLYSQLGYSTGKFQALHQIRFAVFGAVH